jgi:spore germination protein YaaH
LLAPGGRDAFIENISSYLSQNNLDCIDVDLEGQGVTGDYGAFVEALGARLHAEGKEVTAAVARWFGDNITAGALQTFDFINVMAYDLCPFWGTAPCEHSSIEVMTSEMNYWISDRGVPAEKTVLGVPFYGYRWQAGSAGEALTAQEIVHTYGASAQSDWFESAGATIVYNTPATLAQKANLAKSYGGIMIWELGQDLDGDASLLKAIADAL